MPNIPECRMSNLSVYTNNNRVSIYIDIPQRRWTSNIYFFFFFKGGRLSLLDNEKFAVNCLFYFYSCSVLINRLTGYMVLIFLSKSVNHSKWIALITFLGSSLIMPIHYSSVDTNGGIGAEFGQIGFCAICCDLVATKFILFSFVAMIFWANCY